MKATCLVTISAFTLAVLHSNRAHAYNYNTHSRIAELAIRAMRANEVGTLTPPTDPQEAALFTQYLDAVHAAPARLSLMHTGLPREQAQGTVDLVPLGASTAYPFVTYNADVCDLKVSETRDLNQIGSFRITDLDYFPARHAEPCGLKLPSAEADRGNGRDVPNRVLELVLGWHAASVDDHLDDTVLWIRPTLVGWYGLYFEAASLVFEVGVGAILLPFVCLAEAIFGDGCDLGDSFSLARKYNPVDFIQGAIPGVGDMRSDNFTGLWHFEDVDASIHRFNHTRGMWYPGAGPSYPGAVDVVIGAGAQAIGLSLNALSSDGDDQYGKYDEVGRLFPEWQAHTIGMLEFSPLHNLARYGWDKFTSGGGQDSSALAWPLHAIGDACAPQHVVGSTSWGHRPYEEVIDHQGDCFLPRSNLDSSGVAIDGLGKQQLTRALMLGFRWWKQFHAGNDMAKLITDLATETRTDVALEGDWPFRDLNSVVWQVANDKGERDMREAIFPGDTATCSLGGNFNDAQALLENGIGAAIAVLAEAATKVPNVPRGNIDCPSGQNFAISSIIQQVPPDPDTGSAGYTLDYTPSGCGLAPAVRGPLTPVNLVTPPAVDGGSGCTSPCTNSNQCPGTDVCTAGCCMPVVK